MKTKAPTATKCGRRKEAAETAVITKDIAEVKYKEEVTAVIMKEVLEIKNKEEVTAIIAKDITKKSLLSSGRTSQKSKTREKVVERRKKWRLTSS
jgi:hypothetical protein